MTNRPDPLHDIAERTLALGNISHALWSMPDISDERRQWLIECGFALIARQPLPEWNERDECDE